MARADEGARVEPHDAAAAAAHLIRAVRVELRRGERGGDRSRAGAAHDTATRARASDGDGVTPRAIYCAACRSRITTEEERIDVAGAHQHRFTNPADVTFEIGCFRAALGCRVVGVPTLEHTWFAGCAWSFAACANCDAHLGWCYEGADRFFGLILSALAREDEL